MPHDRADAPLDHGILGHEGTPERGRPGAGGEGRLRASRGQPESHAGPAPWSAELARPGTGGRAQRERAAAAAGDHQAVARQPDERAARRVPRQLEADADVVGGGEPMSPGVHGRKGGTRGQRGEGCRNERGRDGEHA